MDKDILLTAMVNPKTRKVLVTGAPVGEVPVIKRGSFGDLHRMIDQVWVEMLRREPQVVKQIDAAGDKAVEADLAKDEPVESDPVEIAPEPAADAGTFPEIVPNDAGYKIVLAPADVGAGQGAYEQPSML